MDSEQQKNFRTFSGICQLKIDFQLSLHSTYKCKMDEIQPEKREKIHHGAQNWSVDALLRFSNDSEQRKKIFEFLPAFS